LNIGAFSDATSARRPMTRKEQATWPLQQQRLRRKAPMRPMRPMSLMQPMQPTRLMRPR
jgi:hypothetical protein